jgi:hypothetical protein
MQGSRFEFIWMEMNSSAASSTAAVHRSGMLRTAGHRPSYCTAPSIDAFQSIRAERFIENFGTKAEMAIYRKEGHGLTRRANELDAMNASKTGLTGTCSTNGDPLAAIKLTIDDFRNSSKSPARNAREAALIF